MPAPRQDLLIEVSTTLDGSGNYTGSWIDSGGVRELLVVYTPGTQGVQVELSIDGSTALTNSGDSVTTGSLKSIAGRYFRLKVVGGTANAAFWALGRAWS